LKQAQPLREVAGIFQLSSETEKGSVSAYYH
jgi:hypothetical protein